MRKATGRLHVRIQITKKCLRITLKENCFRHFRIFLLLEACVGDSGSPVLMDNEKPEKIAAVYVAGSDSNIGACGVLPGSKGIVEKLTHPVINFWINNFPK